MVAPARLAAGKLLLAIEKGRGHSDDLLNAPGMDELAPADRNLATEITYGTLRWRGWLDHVLATAISRPLSETDANLRSLLRMSLYQMSHLNRVPVHAVINDAVEIAKSTRKAGAGGFVNAVLRRLDRERPWQSAGVYQGFPPWARASLPQWLWRRWERRYGGEAALEYALSLNRPPRAALRVMQGGAPDVPASVYPSECVPGCYLSERDARLRAVEGMYMMDEASQLVPYLLGRIEGARIWEPCAAPGGKTLILCERCAPSGRVISSDLSESRLRHVRQRLSPRHGGGCEILVADASATTPFRIEFDAVLLDAPCSGLGTLRRNPEIKWRIRPRRLMEFSAIQGRMLDALSGSVCVGGRLLYSTCSTEPEENEQAVERFLGRHPGFRLIRPEDPPGVERWLDASGLFRTFPGGRIWDGFFAALMVRIS